MRWLILLSLILLTVVRPAQRALADNQQAPDFGPLASLIDEWQGKDPEGKPMALSYHWTGGGTSPVETMASDTPVMTTMCHADKDRLRLTHYCILGNQPRMRAESGSFTRMERRCRTGLNFPV